MKLNDILDIEFPIIQGGMANIANGEFAANVSNAGGLGIIAVGGMNGEQLLNEIKICKSKTKKPFGVNIMLMNPHTDQFADIVIDENIKVVTTGAGNPSKYIEKWKKAGILVIPVVPSVTLAKLMERAGADMVIAEGTESGGHVGELTTMALVPQVCKAVKIPVIAAGGIATGGQFIAAIALGACGVQVGTCLLVSSECPVHGNYKNLILKAKDTSTIVTGRTIGAPVRTIKNPMSKEYIKLEKTVTDKMELEHLTLGSLRKAVIDGDVKMGSFMAGQVAGLLNEIKPIRKIFEDVMNESEKILKEIGIKYGK